MTTPTTAEQEHPETEPVHSWRLDRQLLHGSKAASSQNGFAKKQKSL
jgi:hypothetical protein